MHHLELRVPPLAVLLICGILMHYAVQFVPFLSIPISRSSAFLTAIVFAVCGVIIILISALAFHRANTTVNPLRPDLASSLVVSGIYQYSRNPIYVGLVFILFGWGIYLANFIALAFIMLFVLYINRFQIQPEERALSQLFGAQFKRYQSQVRKWL